jgi:PA domain
MSGVTNTTNASNLNKASGNVIANTITVKEELVLNCDVRHRSRMGVIKFKNDVKFEKDVNICGDLTVTDLNATGDLSIDGDLTTCGDHLLKGDETIQGDSTIQGSSTIQGNQVVQGNQIVQGELCANSDATFKMNVEVQGDVEIQGNTVIQKDLCVQGDTALDGTLRVCMDTEIDLSDDVECMPLAAREQVHTINIANTKKSSLELCWDDTDAELDLHVFAPGAEVPSHPDNNTGAVASTFVQPGKIYFNGSVGELQFIDPAGASVAGSIDLVPALAGGERLNRCTVDPCTGLLYTFAEGLNNNVIRVDPSTGEWSAIGELVLPHGGHRASVAFAPDGTLYACEGWYSSGDFFPGDLLVIDKSNAAVLSNKGTTSTPIVSTAVDPTTGILYGISHFVDDFGGTTSLVTLSTVDATTTVIGEIPIDSLVGLTFNDVGKLYTVANGTGDLLEINKSNATVLTTLPFSGGSGVGLAWGYPLVTASAVPSKAGKKYLKVNFNVVGNWNLKVVLRSASNPAFNGEPNYTVKDNVLLVEGGNAATRGSLQVAEDANVIGALNVCDDVCIEGDLKFAKKLEPVPKFTKDFSGDAPTFVMSCDLTIDTHEILIVGAVIAGGGSADEFPMSGIPTGDLALNSSTNSGTGLTFTNIIGDGVFDGPWTFLDDLPGADDGVLVLKCGVDNDFVPEPGFDVNPDLFTPLNATNSTARMTLDTVGFPGKTSIVDLHLGYSVEPDYDFIRVFRNGVEIYTASGAGPSVMDPYRQADPAVLKNLLLGPNDNIEVVFEKDEGWLAGVDTLYFYAKNLRLVDIGPPPALNVCRKGLEIFEYGNYHNFAEAKIGEMGIFQKTLHLLTGDVLKLTFDTNVYDDYQIRLCSRPSPLGKEYRETCQVAVAEFNAIQYSTKTPINKHKIGGWYEADSRFYGACFIVDDGYQFRIRGNSLRSAGRYFVHHLSVWNTVSEVPFRKIGPNRYVEDQGRDFYYDFNPQTGEILLDMTDVASATQAGLSFQARVFRPVGNPDERYWKYANDLQDFNHIYNEPQEFFWFLYNSYMAGKLSAFVSRAKPSIDLNLLSEDFSQYKRSFGAGSRGEFDAVYKKLVTNGIERKYNIKRLIYWPQCYKLVDALETFGNTTVRVNHADHPFMAMDKFTIDCALTSKGVPSTELNGDHEVSAAGTDWYEFTVSTSASGSESGLGGNIVVKGITKAQQSSLRWLVSQQRPGYLGIICDVPDEGEKIWCKLIPGDTVTMTGSGTRLDDTPLRLANEAFHSGPKPSREFVPDDQYDDWAFSTIRLPLVIDSGNNEFQGMADGSAFHLVLPVGNYYITDIFDYINDRLPSLHAMIWSFSSQLIIMGAIGDSINGPEHASPSTLLGPSGLNVGGLFSPPGTPLSSTTLVGQPWIEFDGVILQTDENVPASYNYHTPLNDSEVALLQSNMSVIEVGAMHGPVRNDMPYNNFCGCVAELLSTCMTEIHTSFFPYTRSCGDGLEELFPTFDRMRALVDQYTVQIDPNRTLSTDLQTWTFVPELGRAPLGYTQWGHPAEMSEMYTNNFAYRQEDSRYDFERIRGKLVWEAQNHFTYPRKTMVTFDSGTYDLAARQVDIPFVNYLKDPRWVMSQTDPSAAPDFLFTPYSEHYQGHARLVITSGHDSSIETVFDTWMPQESRPNDEPVYGTVDNHGADVPFTDGGGVADVNEFVLADPIDASGPLQAACSGRVVFIRTNTDWTAKTLVAEAAGAIGVIFFNSVPDTDEAVFTRFLFTTDLTGTTIPISLIDYQDGMDIAGYTGGDPLVVTNYDMSKTAGSNTSGKFSNGWSTGYVYGHYLVGVVRDDKVEQALREMGKLGPTDPAPATYGYLSHIESSFFFIGDHTLMPWYDEAANTRRTMEFPTQVAYLCAGRILEYFSSQNVDHIILDIRNTGGGGNLLMTALSRLTGGDREFSNTTMVSIFDLDPAGVQCGIDSRNIAQNRIDLGVPTSDYLPDSRLCKPSDFEALVPEGFPATGFFKGSEGNTKKLLYMVTGTTTSATQGAYLNWKGTSMDTVEFDGDFGSDTKFIGYGAYYRPFSTGNGSGLIGNWYGKNRAGEEDHISAPIFHIAPYHTVRNCYVEDRMANEGAISSEGVIKAFDQEFGRFQQPQLKWNMNADVFFQDIGYTVEEGDKYNVAIADAAVGVRGAPSAGTSGFSISQSIAGTASRAQTIDLNVAGSDPAGINGKYFDMEDMSGTVRFWYDVDDSGTAAPADPGRLVEITTVVTADTDLEIAQKTQVAVHADAQYSAYLGTFNAYDKGLPWVSRRHPAGSVDYNDLLTYRDSALEKAFWVLIDPAVETHYYEDDGEYDL